MDSGSTVMVFDGLVYVVLTHDIDCPRQGPRFNYIIARKDRFPPSVIERLLSAPSYITPTTVFPT